MNQQLTTERIERILDMCFPERPGAQERERERHLNSIRHREFYYPVRPEFLLASNDYASGQNCCIGRNCDCSDFKRNPLTEASVDGNKNESIEDAIKANNNEGCTGNPSFAISSNGGESNYGGSKTQSDDDKNGGADVGVEDNHDYPDIGSQSEKFAGIVFKTSNKENNHLKLHTEPLEAAEVVTNPTACSSHSLHGKKDFSPDLSDVEMPRGNFNSLNNSDDEIIQGASSPFEYSEIQSPPHPASDFKSPEFQFRSSLDLSDLIDRDNSSLGKKLSFPSPSDSSGGDLVHHNNGLHSFLDSIPSQCKPVPSRESFDTSIAAKEWIIKLIGPIEDVDGDGNCGYRAIIKAFAHTKEAFKVDSLPCFGESKEDLLKLRKSFKKWCLDNLCLFMEDGKNNPVIGWGKELDTLDFLPFYQKNMRGSTSLEDRFNKVAGDEIFSNDEQDYFPSKDEEKEKIYLDVLKHLPLLAYMFKTTIICYGIPRFQIDQETQQRRLVERSTTTFCIYHPDVRKVQCFVESAFVVPPPNVSIITLSEKHFQWVRSHPIPKNVAVTVNNQQTDLDKNKCKQTMIPQEATNESPPDLDEIAHGKSDESAVNGNSNGSSFNTMNIDIARQDILDFINNGEVGRRPYLEPVPWSSDEVSSFTFTPSDFGKLFLLDWYEDDGPQKQTRNGSLALRFYRTRAVGNYQKVFKYDVVGDSDENFSGYQLHHFQLFFTHDEINYESMQEDVVFHSIAFVRATKRNCKRKRTAKRM